MKLQLLSDLHLETETFDPVPAPGAELLVLAGDIDSGWGGYERFAGWPVPVVVVAGNHEFDGRDFDAALAGLRGLCARLGFSFLEREALNLSDSAGRRVRVLGTTRWSDFDLFGADQRPRAERAAAYFLRLMGSTRGGQPFDAAAVRSESLLCRQWLEAELQRAPQGRWDKTLVITHFAPSLQSADPRYGKQPGTAASATPTMTCCPAPMSGCTATCTAGTTTASRAPAVRPRACAARHVAWRTRARTRALTAAC